MVIMGLTAANDSSLSTDAAFSALLVALDEEGRFEDYVGAPQIDNILATAVAVPVFRGLSLLDIAAPLADDASTANNFPEGPPLDASWETIADGFGMSELNTADDFFVTVIDPFTGEELYGVQIINWAAEYQYTGFIVRNNLPAEVLLWMAEQDPSIWENISDETLRELPEDVIAELPDDIQARAATLE